MGARTYRRPSNGRSLEGSSRFLSQLLLASQPRLFGLSLYLLPGVPTTEKPCGTFDGAAVREFVPEIVDSSSVHSRPSLR